MEALSLLTLLSFGFVVGIRHAFEADHLVAVSTIVSQTKSLKKSSLFGAVWGLGHTTTLFFVGLAVLVLKISIPDGLAISLEFLVGIVLVLLGLDVLRKVVKNKLHAHAHKHIAYSHAHLHSHQLSKFHSHAHRSFAVGLIHGLAGSAALMLLVLASVNSIASGLFYILVFGLGSVVGMVLMGGLISLPFLFTSKFKNVNRGVQILSGLTSIFVGVLIMLNLAVL